MPLPAPCAVLLTGADLFKMVFPEGERGTDRHVHIEILVGAESSSEMNAGLALLVSAVLQQPLSILVSVDGVERFIILIGES